VLNGLDLFPIASGFQARISSYNVYSADSETGPFDTKLNTNLVSYLGCGATQSYFDFGPVLPRWYTVSSYDEIDDQESGLSTAVIATSDTNPPEWGETIGIKSAYSFGSHSVMLGWDKAIDNEGLNVEYTVYWDTQFPIRYDTFAQKAERVYANPGKWDELTYTVGGLSPGIDYYFGVRAFDIADPPNGEDNTETVSLNITGWQYRTIDDTNQVDPSHASIDANTDGLRYVTYLDNLNWRLLGGYAYRDGDWTTEVVDESAQVGQHNSTRLDSMGGVHTIYHDMENGRLKYGYKPDALSAGGWQIEEADDASDNVGGWGYMLLDNLNRPAASYADLENWQLKFAWKLDTGWQHELVGDYETDPSLDEAQTRLQFVSGLPSLIYREPGSGYLYRYTRSSGDPQVAGIWSREDIATHAPHRFAAFSAPDDDSDDDIDFTFSIGLFNDLNYGITVSQRVSQDWYRFADIQTLSTYILDQDLETTRAGSLLHSYQSPTGAINLNMMKFGGTSGSYTDNYDWLQAGAAGFDTYVKKSIWNEDAVAETGVVMNNTEGDFVEPRRYFLGARLRF